MPLTVNVTLEGKQVTLDAANPSVVIGRDPNTCGMLADDTSVSRRHVEVFLKGERAYLRDLGSSNGTWIDGAPATEAAILLSPDQQIFVGHVPLLIEWSGGVGATVVGELPQVIRDMIEARKAAAAAAAAGTPIPAPQQLVPAPQAAVQTSSPPVRSGTPAAPAAAPPAEDAPSQLEIGGADAPEAREFTYRRQGSTKNGVLLLALRQDTFWNNSLIEGFLEFTALDNEKINHVTVELVEVHRKGSKRGHTWDRLLVRQGPWKTKKGDVLPLTFQLRAPAGTSMSGPDVHWMIRGHVDINWAFDIFTELPITMRNLDVERVRDALGALDYRMETLDSQPRGQQFKGIFQPPMQLRKDLGVSQIKLTIDYLGANLKVTMEVVKTKLFKFDKRTEVVFDLDKFRAAQTDDLIKHFQQEIDLMMAM